MHADRGLDTSFHSLLISFMIFFLSFFQINKLEIIYAKSLIHLTTGFISWLLFIFPVMFCDAYKILCLILHLFLDLVKTIFMWMFLRKCMK